MTPAQEAASREFMEAANRLPTIFDLVDDGRSLLAQLDDVMEERDDETNEELEARRAKQAELELVLDVNDVAFLAKADGYVAVLSELKWLHAERKRHAQRLAVRAKSAERAEAWLKDRLLTAMKIAGRDRLETGRFTIRIQQNPIAADVFDEAAVPGQFKEIRTTVHVDLMAIKKWAKETGSPVPGVVLSRGESLRIS